MSEAHTSSRGLLPLRFRELREYLCQLGEHINVIHNSIEKIELSISQIQNDHRSHIEQSGRELQQIKETMVPKSEVESLLQELNEAVKGTFPSIPPVIPEQTSQEDVGKSEHV